MCSNIVSCPLCCQMTFSNIDTLRIRLIKAANGPLTCPICNDILLGLDKLTIHLFSHTNLMGITSSSSSTSLLDSAKIISSVNNNNNNNNNNNDNKIFINLNNKINEIKTNNNNNNDNDNSDNVNTNKSNKLIKVSSENDITHAKISMKNQNSFSSSALTSSSLLSLASLPIAILPLSSISSPATTTTINTTTTTATTTTTSSILNQMKIQTDDSNNSKNNFNINDHKQNIQQQKQQQIQSKCDICNINFNSNNDLLLMHNKLIHNKILNDTKLNSTTINKDHHYSTRFQCHLCSKIFKMKGSLRIHLKVVHNAIHYNDLNLFEKLRKKDENTTTNMIITEVQDNSTLTITTNNDINTQFVTPSSLNSNPSVQQYHDQQQQIQIIRGGHQEFIVKPIISDKKSILNNDDIEKNHYEITINQNNNGIDENSSSIVTGSGQQNLNENSSWNNNNSYGNGYGNNYDSTSKNWECDICSKSFTTKYFLKKHKRLHTGEMPYTCELCGKTFTFQQSYHKHLLYHSDEKPHSCSTCGRSFKELSTLHNHERIHSGEKPFKCENCGKCFRQRVSYLVHKRIHTGVMPYKCSICNKSFRYKVSQRTHKCSGVQQQQQQQELVNSNALLIPIPISSPSSGSPQVTEKITTLSTAVFSSIQQTSPLSTPTTSVTPPPTNDLLQGLLQSASIIPEDSEDDPSTPKSNECRNSNKNTDEYENNQLHDGNPDGEDNDFVKSIDEIVAEQCDKMGIKTNSDNPIEDIEENRIPSPSEKLQNLCLYSPTTPQSSFISNLETMNEDTFKQLLFGIDENWNATY